MRGAYYSDDLSGALVFINPFDRESRLFSRHVFLKSVIFFLNSRGVLDIFSSWTIMERGQENSLPQMHFGYMGTSEKNIFINFDL